MSNNETLEGETPAKKYWPTTARVLLFCILCSVALIVANNVTQGIKGIWSQILTAALALIVALILTKLFSRWEGMTMEDVGLKPHKKSFSKFVTGWGIGLLLATLQPILILVSGHIKLGLTPGFSFNTIITSFLLYLVLACREEVAFRGYPVFGLNKAAGPWLALTFTGIIFTVEHKAGGMNWLPAIFGAGVGSILFGIAALKTKGIAFPIGLHSAWNFGQNMFGFKIEPGLLRMTTEKGFENRVEVVGWISYLLVMGLAIIALCYAWRKDQKVQENNSSF